MISASFDVSQPGRGAGGRLAPLTLAFLLLAALCPPAAVAAGSPVEVTGLRVDQEASPLGIDNETPSLGWKLSSDRRGEAQSAYQVQVAADLAELGSNPVWDSEKVESPESVAVPYGGPPPQPAQRYFWRVRVWDGEDAVSEWSEPSSWEMGLLAPDDWQGAKWIRPQAPTDAANWSDYRLEVDFTIASGAGGVVFRARDPSNFYMWQLLVDGEEEAVLLRPHVRENGVWDVLDEVDVSAAIPFADALVTHELTITADGQSIATEIDGAPVDEREDETFATGATGFRSGDNSEDAKFDNLRVSDLGGMELFADDFAAAPDPAFPGAEIEAGALRVRKGSLTLIATTPPAPLLRKEFGLERPLAEVSSARAYAYGLGLYELRLSGAKVGDRELTPAAANYAERLRFQTYDVTGLLREGENALGMTLAEGYGPTFSRFGWRWLGPRQALLLLDVTYADGSHQRIASDESWRWSEGPIRAASIYDGETYDARREQHGWDEPGFDLDEGEWQSVQEVAAPAGALEADTTPPLRVARTLTPVELSEPEAGVHVFDLGENVAGWARLHAQGPAATTVRMRYAENVAADGSLDPFTNRDAEATDTFVLAGTGATETYEPSFTHHGFRYVEVAGLPGPVTLDTLEGRAVHADLEPTASFESSLPLLDTIYANNRRTMANNAMSYPTDTPTRDERTGPGMDVQAYGDAAVRDFAAGRFFSAYLEEIGRESGGSPDMNAAHIPLAWSLYEQYGDRATLLRFYPWMKAAVDQYEVETGDGVWAPGSEEHDNGFGDWCPPPPEDEANGGLGGPQAGGYEDCFSEVSLVNTALAYRNAGIVARAAATLEEPAEADHYGDVAEQIGAAFEAQFATSDGYGSGRQVTGVLPLAFGMVSAARAEAVGQGLVERILGEDEGHLDTGIFGTRFLIDALVAAGRPDVALTVLGQTSYPGFGYQIGLGATSAWEQWVYRSGMGTHDHAMFAGINTSFVTGFGGIEPLEPGYAKVRIAPVTPDGLNRAAVSLQTVRGEVKSEWERSGDGLSLKVTVPTNATAEVSVPLAPGLEVRESGVPAGESPGVDPGGTMDGAALYTVGSGEYRFTTTPPPAPDPEPEPEPDDESSDNADPVRAPVLPAPAATPTRPPAADPGRPSARRPARVRVRGRLGGRRRLVLVIACRVGCSVGKRRRVRLTVTPVGRRRPILARRRTRLGALRNRVVLRLRRQFRPRRVKVRIAGLPGRPLVATVRLAPRRR